MSVSRLALALAGAGVEVGLWSSDGSVATTELIPAQRPHALACLTGKAHEALALCQPDIVHDNGLWWAHNHRLARLSADLHLPRVVSTRGMLEPWARAHKKLKKDVGWLLYQRRDLVRAAALHATAEREAQTLVALRLGVPVHTIPNAVDIPELSARARAGSAKSVRTAVFLGRIYPVKGLPMLIEAWGRARPQGWRLVLGGPDEAGHKAELETLIAAGGLGEAISFAGPLAGDAKAEFLAQAHLFILPSHTESFGIVVAEALAHGTPVLTTTATPWPMLSQRGCGWTVEPSVEGLAGGLRHALASDAQTLAAMGEKGRAWVASDFGWQRVAQQFVSAYQEILAQRPRATCRPVQVG